MKTKLLVLILGAALIGSSTAALAGPGKGRGHDRPRAEQGHQRHGAGHQVRKDRIHPRHDRHARGHRHGPPRWAQGHRGHGWSKHRPHRHYGRRAAPYPRYHSRARHYRGHEPINSLSIILHGHF